MSRRIALGVAMWLAAMSGVEGQAWVQKGPAPARFGQPENITDSPIAGALEAVLAHPSNADTLWVAAVNGGIFRTADATATSPTWVAQTDALGSLSIAALERDPTDGTHNTLVAAVGRTSSYGSVGGVLQGVLRTTNGGTNWTLLASTGVNDKSLRGVAARGAIIVTAVTGPIACSAVGIWRSTDTGASFTQISDNVGVTGMPCGFSWDLASDPTDSTRLFAPATGLGVASDGLYRSSDTGATWTQVGSGSVMDTALQSLPSEAQVVVGNAGGANANVFVAVCAGSSLSGLYHSADAGSNWSSLDLPGSTENGPTFYGIHPGGQCGIHLSLVPDPTDHSVVYIGGDRQPAANENVGGNSFPNSIGASTFGGRLFKVDADLPGGSQARPITNCDSVPGPLPAGCGGTQSTASDTAPHADSREMVFDANGDLIQVDDGGVYRHTDPSGTGGDWESVIGNLGAVEQHDAQYDTVSDIIISGNQDNGTTRQDTSASTVWSTIFGGDGGDVVVAHDDPVASQSTRYLSAQGLGGLRRNVYDASNVFQGATNPTLTLLAASPAISPAFRTPLEVNAQDPTRVILGAANGVYESLDRLDSVTQISTDAITSFTGGGPIAYGRPGNAELLYYGTDTDICQRIGVPGSAIGCSTETADLRGITGVVVDPDSDTQAFATDADTVFRTTNAGGLWTNITGDLFTAPGNNAGNINSVAYINSGGDRLVVGTDSGVYAATEASGFTTWTQLGTDLPNALVYELDYDATDNVLLAGTMGRGSWLLDLSAGCPANLTLSNTTLGTPTTYYASDTITLGPSLLIDGAGVQMVAQKIAIASGTTIANQFSATIGLCP